MEGTLYVIAVPIGNLEDVTLRAKRVLSEVSLIACEDTRKTKHLLAALDIACPKLVACYAEVERARADSILDFVEEGKQVGLVCDAGTPALSDPGGHLVLRARERGLSVVPVPGVSSIVTLLSCAGLPATDYRFLGFLPRTQKKRQDRLLEIKTSPWVSVVFESPKRLRGMLADAATVFEAGRQIVVGRELTKIHESIYRGTAEELLEQEIMEKGEVVVAFSPGTPEMPAWHHLAIALVKEGLSSKTVSHLLSTHLNVKKREVYESIKDY